MLHHNLPIQPIHTYLSLSLAIISSIHTYLAYWCLSIPISIHPTIVGRMQHILHHNLPIQPIQAYLNLSLAIQPHIINSYLSIPIQPICTYLYLLASTSLQSAIYRHMLHHILPIQPIQTYPNLSLVIQPHIINSYLSLPIQPIGAYLYLSAYTPLQLAVCSISCIITYLSSLFRPI